MYYKIFTQRVCAELMLKGFKLKGLIPDEKNAGFNIFLFEETDQLKLALDTIKRKGK